MSRRRRTGSGVARRLTDHSLWIVGLLLILLAALGPRLADRVGWSDGDLNDAATSTDTVPQSPRSPTSPFGIPLDELPGSANADSTAGRPAADGSHDPPERSSAGRDPASVTNSALPGAFDATVLVVRDGDSVDVRDLDGRTIRIRLHGIDAPEYGQPHFRGSTAFVRRRLAGRPVRVVPIAIDRYDRLVGEIWLDGRRFNSEIVRQGWAWFYRQYAEGDDELAAAESEARSNARGLWADPSPQPPWIWRRQPGR